MHKITKATLIPPGTVFEGGLAIGGGEVDTLVKPAPNGTVATLSPIIDLSDATTRRLSELYALAQGAAQAAQAAVSLAQQMEARYQQTITVYLEALGYDVKKWQIKSVDFARGQVELTPVEG